MAYNSNGLSAAGGQSKAGNAPQMWTYSSADAIATVNTSGYFNNASALLKVGDVITPDSVRSVRPGYGLAPKYTDDVLGSKAIMPITKNTPVTIGSFKK